MLREEKLNQEGRRIQFGGVSSAVFSLSGCIWVNDPPSLSVQVTYPDNMEVCLSALTSEVGSKYGDRKVLKMVR